MAKKKTKKGPTMTVPPGVFQLAKVAAEERTRYGIDGVRFCREDDRNTAVATDGRMLVELSWLAQGNASEFPASIVNRHHCFLSAEQNNPTDLLVVDGRAQTIRQRRDCIIETSSELLDATFPDYKQVIPDYGPKAASTFAVRPKLLLRLLTVIVRALKDAQDKCAILVTIPKDHKRPIVMRTKCDPGARAPLEAVGVLMPVKAGLDDAD